MSPTIPDELWQKIFDDATWISLPSAPTLHTSAADFFIRKDLRGLWRNEIVFRISAILNLIRVSKLWYRVAIECLYSALFIWSPTQLGNLLASIERNPGLGRHVRLVTLDDSLGSDEADKVSQALAYFPTIRVSHNISPALLLPVSERSATQVLEFLRVAIHTTDEFLLLLKVLRCCPNLRFCDLVTEFKTGPEEIDPDARNANLPSLLCLSVTGDYASALMRPISGWTMPRLRGLQIYNSETPNGDVIPPNLLIPFQPHLQHLSININIDAKTATVPPLVLNSLTHLRIYENTGIDLEKLVERLPVLTTLELYCDRDATAVALEKHIRFVSATAIAPKLKQVVLKKTNSESVKQSLEVLRVRNVDVKLNGN